MSPTSLSHNGDLIGDLRVDVSGDAATVPDYLEQLRLPGDDDVLAEVASLRESLMGAENEAARIRRNHVNQVDNHREAHNLDMAAVRGLLVVNAYREAMDLARACPPSVVASARR